MRRAYDEKYRFLSTPSARRATAWSFATRSPTIISIHALREEGDVSGPASPAREPVFLSTPSARRATPSTTLPKSNTRNFYPRPPRGGRPRPRRRRCWRRSNFYPRPPRGGRRYSDVPLDDHVRISIHALREEGDLRAFASTLGALRISIHALREEGDRLWSTDTVGRIRFLSTPSARRATGLGDKWFQDHQISIHALREEGDHSPASSAPMALYFYPRPPRGGRPGCTTADGNAEVISIHALREEGDPPARRWWT